MSDLSFGDVPSRDGLVNPGYSINTRWRWVGWWKPFGEYYSYAAYVRKPRSGDTKANRRQYLKFLYGDKVPNPESLVSFMPAKAYDE